MMARLVSIPDVTKPMLYVGSDDLSRPKRNLAKNARRIIDVIVTL
jgi:hypothetical protein